MNPARYRTFAAALLCTVCSVSMPAQSSAPVQATAQVDDAALATTGRATLQLRFTSEAPLRTPYAVRVELHAQGRMILRRVAPALNPLLDPAQAGFRWGAPPPWSPVSARS